MLKRFVRGLFATEEVCPYCFETFRLKDAPFRCASPADLCAPEKDDLLARSWQDARLLGKVVPSPGRFARSVRCADCNKETHKRLCPQCHMELPPTIGELKSYIFAVIGAKEAGKSHYISVLIDHWTKQLGPSLDILLSALDDRTRSKYRETFYNPIYRRKTVIAGTKSSLTAVETRMPLIYTLTFSGRDLFGRKRIKKAVTLVFFDTAGEDLDSLDTLSAVNKYIYRSDGILLLLDPLQLGYVRDQLGSTTPLPEQNTETLDILERVADLVRNGRKLDRKTAIPIPLAVSFSKCDAMEPLIEPHYQINADANHAMGFDSEDSAAVSAEMESLIAQWQGQDLLHQVKTQFKRYAFFGLSALGCNPHADHKIPRVIPKRVEDPFLWLLNQHRLIKARKRS